MTKSVAQNTAELANEVELYALTLDVYGDAIFAPYEDMISFLGAGVRLETDEQETKLKK